MSQQLPDPFIWRGRKWVFLGADKVYSLFDPKKYGLSPSAPSTACWKGFVIRFSVRRRRLFWDRLDVYCKNNVYPKIAGVSPIKIFYMDFRRYWNLHQRLNYSGTITIGRKPLKEYDDCAFCGPDTYEIVYQLTFQDGVLQDALDVSGEFTGF